MRGARLARTGLAFVLAAIAGGLQGWAEPTAAVADDPFAYAPEGEWPMQDGCPARTRATPTRLLAGELEIAWTLDAPASLAGDPRVAGDRVYVGTDPDAAGISYLDVLRLSDGAPVVPRRKVAGGPPQRVGAWQDFVVVPADRDQMEVLRVLPETKALVPVARFSGQGEPVIAGNLVLTSSSQGVECRVLGAAASLWHARTEGLVLGPPTVRDGWVRVVTSRVEKGFVGTRSCVESFALTSGSAAPVAVVGWDADMPVHGGESRIVAARDEIYVLHPYGFRLKGEGAGLGARMALAGGQPFKPFFLATPGTPVVWGAQTFLRYRTDEEGDVLVESEPRKYAEDLVTGGWRWIPLARSNDHAELLAARPAPLIAGGVATLPGGAFVVGSRRVLEMYATPQGQVRIPVRETLIEVTDRKVVAYRRARKAVLAEAGPRLPRNADAAPVEIPGGAVVTRDGSVRSGNLTFSPAEGVLAGLGKEKIRYDDVALVVDRDGKIVHGPDPGLAARRLPAAAAARSRAEWLARAKKAVATRSGPVLRQAIEDLAVRGGRADDLAPLRKELARLENPQGAPPKPDAPKIAEIERLRAPLLAREESALATAVAGLPDDAPIAYRAPLLRALLAGPADHAAATAWLRAKLPAGFDPGAEAEPAAWLDLLEATSQTPIAVLARKEGGTMTMDERVYASLRVTWRKDLVALRGDRLLLVTPVARPSRIARCLSLGELACSSLDTLFELTGDQLRTLDPLSIQLFETKDEYQAHAERGADEDERAFLGWSAGTYDPGSGLARLYVPPTDDRFDGVLETLAHELTHAWLSQRMPPPAGAARSEQRADTPNYFLEEGFATMVEEFRYDVEGRTFQTLNPAANSLDTVAGAPELLDWDEVVEQTPKGYRWMDRTAEYKVPFRWVLAMNRNVSKLNLFYAQSAAICHYLWDAEGGKHRATLREWVRDVHANRVARGETKRRLGMSAQELGAAVLAWAKKTSSPAK